ncbi:MAG: tRNA (adenosine(37)-N6)-threonylcarbamoyltransferase complex dimerization subunit type 1 TsaB [Solirubrobacteraceae bacterium]
MRILGLDTATRATAVALLDTSSGEVVTRRDDPPPGARPRHTTRLLVLAVEALQAAGYDWTEVDRIAVGVGPGTFTGLRIGVATAQALARARGIPLVGVSTLHSLAAAAVSGPEDGDGFTDAVVGVIDARRGEVFAAGWTRDSAGVAGSEPVLAPAPRSPGGLAEELAGSGRRWLAVGDGAVEFRQALERAGAWIPAEDSNRNRVDAAEHCRLAVAVAPEAAEAVRPSYLRLPDAELTRRAAQRQ